MKNKKTYYQLILDRSGSMSSCIEETIIGVNGQIRRIWELAARFPGQELFISLNLFNNQLSKVLVRARSQELKEITYADYRPDGTTALLDAIGTTINDLHESIGREVENEEASVVVVVFTDGYENASSRFTFDQVSLMIRELEQTEKWSFSYIGATLDAVEIASRLGVRRDNAIRFSVNDSLAGFRCIDKSLENYIIYKENGKIRQNFLEADEAGTI